MARVAIIGSGIAGLTLANKLCEHAEIIVLEKARGIGGRMSTRYGDDFAFDHGAPYFKATSDEFQAFLAPYIANEVVVEWRPYVVTMQQDGSIEPCEWETHQYVAAPRMNSLCKLLAKDMDVRLKQRVVELMRLDSSWRLICDSGEVIDQVDWVISTAPPMQSADLLPDDMTGYGKIKQASMLGCYSLMVGCQKAITLPYDIAYLEQSPIQQIIVNSMKPHRGREWQSILVQTCPDWTELHMENDQSEVKEALLQELKRLLDIEDLTADYLSLHRWRYAQANSVIGEKYILDKDKQIAACGDWFQGHGVEGAFISAQKLSVTLKGLLI